LQPVQLSSALEVAPVSLSSVSFPPRDPLLRQKEKVMMLPHQRMKLVITQMTQSMHQIRVKMSFSSQSPSHPIHYLQIRLLFVQRSCCWWWQVASLLMQAASPRYPNRHLHYLLVLRVLKMLLVI
jgi:hypothetical protein